MEGEKIVRGFQAGVDDLIPALSVVTGNRGYGKGSVFFFIAVEHDKKMVVLIFICLAAIEEKGQGMTFGRPVLLARHQGLPDDFWIPMNALFTFLMLKEIRPLKERMAFTQLDALFEKTEQSLVLFDQVPVQPVYIVVLAPAVIVSVFAVTEFVTGVDHGDPLGKQQDQDHATHPPMTKLLNILVVGGTFSAAVPADIMVVAISIFFTIVLIMLVIKADEIREGETIVAGDKVDGVKRVAEAGLVEVGATGNPGGQVGHGIVMAGHEGSDIIAELAIPFSPACIGGEGPHLVETGGVPCLGNDLGIAQDRIFGDHLDHRRVGQEMSRGVAAEDGGEVKAEAVNVHLYNPET